MPPIVPQLSLSLFDLKNCNRCCQLLPFACFSKDCTKKDGLSTLCKTCRASSDKLYQQNNRENISARNKTYWLVVKDEKNAAQRQRRAADPEFYRDRNNKFYHEHKEQVRAEQKVYRNANHEKIKLAARLKKRPYSPAKHRIAYLKNKETILERSRLNYAKNKEKHIACCKAWAARHPENAADRVRRRTIKKRGNGGSHTLAQWDELKAQCDNRCLRCKRKEPDIELTRDHVMPVSLGGSDNIENIQCLCRPCNSSKHIKTTDYRFVNPI